MNIFYLDSNAMACAEQHVDKHVVKMIIEYAQLLSTAHRVLDGVPQRLRRETTGRQYTKYSLSDDRDGVLYSATHINHPSAKWARHTVANYNWLYSLWCCLLDEYTHRYGKVHSCDRLRHHLRNAPNNISNGEFSAPWRAMPDEFKFAHDVVDYTVKSYRAYYNGAKSHMFKWKNRQQPEWVVLT